MVLNSVFEEGLWGKDRDLFNKKFDIIDWGCGQGLATMLYLDFLNSKNTNQIVNSINLVEPSIMALKKKESLYI